MAQDQQCLYNCADIAGACISPEAKQIIHALRKQRIVSTSVSLPRTEDKKTQAGSEHNE